MQDRYMVRDRVLGSNHPVHPNKQVYFVFDRKKQEYGLAYYLTWEAANNAAKRKNGV